MNIISQIAGGVVLIGAYTIVKRAINRHQNKRLFADFIARHPEFVEKMEKKMTATPA